MGSVDWRSAKSFEYKSYSYILSLNRDLGVLVEVHAPGSVGALKRRSFSTDHEGCFVVSPVHEAHVWARSYVDHRITAIAAINEVDPNESRG